MPVLDQDLQMIGPLLEQGRLVELRSHLLRIWPPHAYLDGDDVHLLSILLRVVSDQFPQQASLLYQPYATRLKSQEAGDFEWLLTIIDRFEGIWTYEGDAACLEWLAEIRPRILPPDDGVIDLLVGRVRLDQGRLEEARQLLSDAVARSIQGMNWYRLDSLNTMCTCLARLGENRLAFEYARTHSIESFKIGRIDHSELGRAVYGLSLLFGQLDYLVEIKRNQAGLLRQQGHKSHAAIEMSDAGFRLAEIGVREEGAQDLYQAYRDAWAGPYPTDTHFALTCLELSRYLKSAPPDPGSLSDSLGANARMLQDNPRAARASLEMKRLLEQRQLPDRRLLDDFRWVCSQHGADPDQSTRDSMNLLVFITTAALLGRYYALQGQTETGHALFEAVNSAASNRDAIFWFVRTDYIEDLIRRARFERALPLAQQALSYAGFNIHERFIARQHLARCFLGSGRRREAYEMALLALSDWVRVLEGLYQEAHKAAWLERGAACIACAVQAIREPVDWMSEAQRRSALFELLEMGKARLTADQVNRRESLSGVYLLSQTFDQKRDFYEVMRQENPDWYTVLTLQTSAFADGFAHIEHNLDGSIHSIQQKDVTWMRGVIQLPLTPEKRLVVSASALPFRRPDSLPVPELYQDLQNMMARSS